MTALAVSSMKKIAMVAAPVHAVPPRKGAAVEWWMYQTCRHLGDVEPHIVCIAAEGYADEEQRDGIAFHRIRIGRHVPTGVPEDSWF